MPLLFLLIKDFSCFQYLIIYSNSEALFHAMVKRRFVTPRGTFYNPWGHFVCLCDCNAFKRKGQGQGLYIFLYN